MQISKRKRKSLTDIELIKKNDKNNSYSIDVKTTKTLLVFSSFIEREKCIHCINQELEKIKKNSNDTKDDKDISKGSSLKGKSRIQMINRNIAIKEMLSRIHFNNKLTEITTKRFNEFTQENEANKLFFIPEKDFDVNYIDIKDMNKIDKKDFLLLAYVNSIFFLSFERFDQYKSYYLQYC